MFRLVEFVFLPVTKMSLATTATSSTTTVVPPRAQSSRVGHVRPLTPTSFVLTAMGFAAMASAAGPNSVTTEMTIIPPTAAMIVNCSPAGRAFATTATVQPKCAIKVVSTALLILGRSVTMAILQVLMAAQVVVSLKLATVGREAIYIKLQIL